MGIGNYISLLNSSGNQGHVALFSSSKGGETAGSVAYNSSSKSRFPYQGGETAGSVAYNSSSKSRFSYQGGETAGSVAYSFSGGSSSCGSSCGSFSAIA